MEKTKIAFVGQPEYFRCLYETDLDEDYDVKEYAISMGDPKRYKVLLEDKSDIMFFFRGEFVPADILSRIKAIRVQLSSEPLPTDTFYTVDRVTRLKMLFANRNKFDKFYHYDKTSIKTLEKNGFDVDGEFIFPVATEFYHRSVRPNPIWDAGFFGRSNNYRESILGIPKRDYNILHVAHGITGDFFNDNLSRCKIGLNIHCEQAPSFEHRLQTMMACGVPCMSQPLTHEDCLKRDKHFVQFEYKDHFLTQFKEFLADEEKRKKIAKAGLEYVRENLSSRKCFGKLIKEIL
jgi:hypothetical protein